MVRDAPVFPKLVVPEDAVNETPRQSPMAYKRAPCEPTCTGIKTVYYLADRSKRLSPRELSYT